MGDISAHFNRSEFACKCGCGQDTVDAALIQKLEVVRLRFNKPITITSGNRCVEYNKQIGGAPASQHLLGRAADIVVKGVSPSEVYKHLDSLEGGLGGYDSFTHVDSRHGKVRW